VKVTQENWLETRNKFLANQWCKSHTSIINVLGSINLINQPYYKVIINQGDIRVATDIKQQRRT
jgi:hypothetical protein